MSTRFVAAPFRWNLRVAAALLPSLAIVSSFGGLPAVAVITVSADHQQQTLNAARFNSPAKPGSVVCPSTLIT